MQQRKSSARQKAVSETRAAVTQAVGRTAREVKAQPTPPESPRGSGQTTLGGHVDRGLTLAALYDTGVLERLRLEVRVRLVADLIQSLAWLHANPRLMAAHPHLVIAPSTIVIGLDGVARVDVRAAKKRESERNPSESDYIAPEILAGDEAADLRADIFSVGVLAWEALSGRRLGEGSSATSAVRVIEREPVSSDVPLALAGRAEPLRRKSSERAVPANDGSRLPPLLLPEEAGWAMPFATRVLAAMSPVREERPQDCKLLMGELDLIAANLASTQEIAEVVQGISAVATLCVPEPTLPEVDAACQNNEWLGFMDRSPCSDSGQQNCAQRVMPVVRRVVGAAPAPAAPPAVVRTAERAREVEPPLSTAAIRLRQIGASPSNHAVWLVVGLVSLAVLGSLAGYMASVFAVR